MQGDYFVSLFRPFSVPDAGTEQEEAALEKYAHFTRTQFPTYSQTEAWLGADLMINGLQMAGSNPSRAVVIKDLRSIKAYNGNGLLPITVNYSTIFGHDPPSCGWVLRAQKSGFVPVSSQPFCGHDVPGTTTISGVVVRLSTREASEDALVPGHRSAGGMLGVTSSMSREKACPIRRKERARRDGGSGGR